MISQTFGPEYVALNINTGIDKIWLKLALSKFNPKIPHTLKKKGTIHQLYNYWTGWVHKIWFTYVCVRKNTINLVK